MFMGAEVDIRSFSFTFHLMFEIGLSPKQEFPDSVRLAGQQAPSEPPISVSTAREIEAHTTASSL